MEIKEIIELVKTTKSIIHDREMAGHIKVKGLADYVTQVDVRVQNYLEEGLKKLAPEIEFLGEETGLHEMGGDTFWILDPIDGTTNLIHGYLHSAVSLGLCHKGEIILGVIYDPYREETFYAEKGKGSFLDGEPIHVSGAMTLKETIIGIGTAPYQKEQAVRNFERFCRIYQESQDIRRTGSAALELAYIACGRQGGYVESRLQPWDFAAGLLLIQEAGGRVSDFGGKTVDPRKAGSIAATNGGIHEELLALL